MCKEIEEMSNKLTDAVINNIYELIQHRLVGFNRRRYDNRMLYARVQDYTNEELYCLSQRIINSKKEDNKNCFFGEAYNISYKEFLERK